MNKGIKIFFEFNRIKLIVFIILFVLLIFTGFFQTHNCFLDDKGIEICRKCGIEGIFNPLLRPFSFTFGNLIDGLIFNDDIVLCGASFTWFLYFPLDIIYLCFLSHLVVSVFNKKRIKNSQISDNKR